MIQYKTGNLLAENAEAIVNTVNCVGVMGRGVALQFKKAFPANFKAYAAACRRGEVLPGRMFVYEMPGLANPRYIINFPTKRHWKGKSRIEDVEAGLSALADEIQGRRICSIALPPLASGLGGLEWEDVKARIELVLGGLQGTKIVVFKPQGDLAPDRTVRNKEVPKMTPGRAVLVALMHRYNAGLLDPMITLLEVHKLMYFMQAAGEPLGLRFQKAEYGPYAENLRHVLHAVEGHLLSGYSDGGDSPAKHLQIVPGAIEDAEAFLGTQQPTNERFKKVAHLVDGFESPLGLELLATVHWVIVHEQAKGLDEVANSTYAWSARKARFTRRQIALAMDTLAQQGWLAPR